MSRRTMRKSLRNTDVFIDKFRAVRKYSMTGVFIAEYKSLHELSMRASENYNVKMIYKCCVRETASSYGHQWRFADDDELAVKPKATTSSSDVVKPKIEFDAAAKKDSVRFLTPLRPFREYEIIGVEDDHIWYKVQDINTEIIEKMNPYDLFWRKIYGDTILGCSFHTNGIIIMLEDVQAFVIPMEMWRSFAVGNQIYVVSNLGRVCVDDGDCTPGVQLLAVDRNGCYSVELLNGFGSSIVCSVANLVAEAFIIDFEAGTKIEYLDGNSHNCALGNLSCNVDKAEFGLVPVEPASKYLYSCINEYSESGNLVGSYLSISEAAAYNDLPIEGIRSSCNRDCLFYADSVWRYDDDDEFEGVDAQQRKARFGNFVRQYDKSGALVEEYKTVIDASEKTGVDVAEIRRCCETDKSHIAGNFVWRFFKDDELKELSEEERVDKMPFETIRQYSAIDGGILNIFNSLAEAESATGISKDVLSVSCLRGTVSIIDECVWRLVRDDELFELDASDRLTVLWRTHVRQSSSTSGSEMIDEVWRPVPMCFYNTQYPNGKFRYEISDSGQVRESGSAVGEGPKLLKQCKKQYSDFLYVVLYDQSGHRHQVSVDTIVATVFCDNPNNYTRVYHKNRDKQDNDASNLIWVN